MYPLAILIGGPTASNKTKLAFEIQSKISSFVVNADSMQVYDQLQTLTNLPSKQELKQHSCNLFGYIRYPNKCNLGVWFNDVKNVLSKSPNKVPIFVGGTGMYLDSLCGEISKIPSIPERINSKIEQLYNSLGNRFFYNKLKKIDKSYSKKISVNDSQRLKRAISVKVGTGKNLSYWHKNKSGKIFKKILYVVIFDDRQKLYNSIDERCLKILQSNAINEVSSFLIKRKAINHPLHKSIGLTSLESYINGALSFEETLKLFCQDTRRYAKRQITWFKNRSLESAKLDFSDAKKFLLRNI